MKEVISGPCPRNRSEIDVVLSRYALTQALHLVTTDLFRQ